MWWHFSNSFGPTQAQFDTGASQPFPPMVVAWA
jgi:hypothetical protein